MRLRTAGSVMLSVVALSWGVCGGAVAQQPGATPTVAPPERLSGESANNPKERDEVRIKDAERARYDSRRGLFYLFGHVQFEDEDMQLSCDEATYNENDDTAACAGHLKLTDPDNVITGDLINADFGAEIVRIQGNVKIVSTRKPAKKEGAAAPAADEKQEPKITTITCDQVIYTYTEGKRHAVATGKLTAVQDDKTVTAPQADYDLEKDTVVLSPSVHIKMTNGNEFEATKATISVTDEWVDMEGFSGVAIRKKKEPAAPAPPSAPPAAPPTPSG